MARWSLPALVLLLLAAACSSASDEPRPQEAAAAEPVAAEPTPETANPSSPDERFCSDGNSFVTDTRTRLVATPDAATFDDIDTLLAGLAEQSPSDIAESVVALREGFAAIGTAYAATGYDPGATLTLDPAVQDASSIASSSLRSYLLANCDLAAVREVQIAQIARAFGIDDIAIAECMHAQLGDLANIESSTLSPELMTAPVCGTSIIGLLSGETTADS